MKYGEKEIREFDINAEENFWPNEHEKNRITSYNVCYTKLLRVSGKRR